MVRPGLEGKIETSLLLAKEFSGSNIHNGSYLPGKLLENAIKLAAINSIDIHTIISVEELNDLRNFVYNKGIETILLEIKTEMTKDEKINKSSLDRCKHLISLAVDYAQKTNYPDIHTRIFDRLLESAKFYGLQNGQKVMYQYCLKEAKKYGLKHGVDISNSIHGLEFELGLRSQ